MGRSCGLAFGGEYWGEGGNIGLLPLVLISDTVFCSLMLVVYSYSEQCICISQGLQKKKICPGRKIRGRSSSSESAQLTTYI